MKRSTLLSAIALCLCTTAFTTQAAEACTQAEMFAPGQISTPELHESRLNFTPDRNTIFWSATDESGPPGAPVTMWIMTADRTASGWSTPTLAPFSGVVPGYTDSDPHVTLDGNSVIFSSNRPGTPSYPLNDLWITHRTANGWSQPVNLGNNVNSAANELYASSDLQGNLYFASDRDGGQWDLYRASAVATAAMRRRRSWTGPQPSHRWEFNPEISPNGRTLLYASFGRQDSYGDVDMYATASSRPASSASRGTSGPA